MFLLSQCARYPYSLSAGQIADQPGQPHIVLAQSAKGGRCNQYSILTQEIALKLKDFKIYLNWGEITFLNSMGKSMIAGFCSEQLISNYII